MGNLQDNIAYMAFCAKLMQRVNEVKGEYNQLSEANKQRLRGDAMNLLNSSGLAELLEIRKEGNEHAEN